MIDIIPSIVTPIFGVESGLEVEQFLIVFEGINKSLHVHFMVFICLLILCIYSYRFDSMLMIMLK
jgi:predicted Co/Zn/Cd cation transporter (cation efflux family)